MARVGRMTRTAATACGMLLALVCLGACAGGSGGGDDSGGSAAADRGAAVAPETASSGAPDGSLRSGVNRGAVRTTAVVKTAEVFLTSRHLDAVRTDAVRLVDAVGGTVDGEDTRNDHRGRVQEATLRLRVPVGSFDATKSAVEKLGRLQHSEGRKKDVTTEVIDVDERVQTLQNSLDRLQKFQRQAQDVSDLLRFEDDITQRQAELQSLEAQQAYLADQTSMSTITLHLSTPERYVPPPDALEHAGFWTGLKSGWHAFVDVVVVALTVLGALVPFLVAGALLGLPVWLLVRMLVRRRRGATAAAPAAPAAPANGG